MARKYDRYGRNRQFRRNPTRSRRFFPYRIPFQADFRLNGPGSLQGAKRKRDDDDDDVGMYERMQYTQSPFKNARNSALGAIGDSILATGLTRIAQGEIKKDIAEIGLRTMILTGMIAI